MTKIRPEFIFLNRLRKSGVTNMFGASPYLSESFDLPYRDAKKVLMDWMAWVDKNPNNINL